MPRNTYGNLPLTFAKLDATALKTQCSAIEGSVVELLRQNKGDLAIFAK